MCGILGVRRSWLAQRRVFLDALDTLGWRGPDHRGSTEVGDWWLGVARLAITDPGAHQPITCPRTGRVAVFNGAVTSAQREWAEYGRDRRTRNDAELALLRLAAGGAGALAATCGPYALAIVDPRDDTLYLARDPEGEKPLLVVCRGRQVVAFASTAAALRALGLDVRLSAEEQARFLRFGFLIAPSLHHPELTLAPPMSGVAVATPGGGLRSVEAKPPAESCSGADLHGRVVAAVDRCSAADVPAALCLSGGVDSSCIAAALAELGRRLPAYQFVARGEPTGERQRARSVAAATGLSLRPVDGGVGVLAALQSLTRQVGLPQGDPSVLAAHATAVAARRDGVRVLLGGEGADDIWLGYRRHRAAAFLPARGLPLLRSLTDRSRFSTTTAARLARAVTAPRPYDTLLAVVPPAFAETVFDQESVPPATLPPGGGDSSLERARFVDRQFYLRSDLLPKCDTAFMAAGIEGRCPYLDPEVLASPEARSADPRAVLGKRALRAAFRHDLPDGVLDQPKLGFGLPLDRWIREDDALLDLLCDRRTRSRPHLRASGLQAMLDCHRSGRANLGHGLYLIAAWELYLRYLEASA